MPPKPFDPARGVAAAIEIRVDRAGPGRRSWRWSIWRDEALLARSPAGFAGAEEAFQAGRMALNRPRAG